MSEHLFGNLGAAERHQREALRIAIAVGYSEGVAISIGDLAYLALDRKDWQGAETLARKALPLSENVGRQELIAADSLRLALALVPQGKRSEALPHALRAVEIFNRLGSPELEEARATLAKCEG